MAQIINLSVKGTKKAPIVAYFEEELDEEIDHFNQAEPELREELYDRMDEIVAKGRKIMQRKKVRKMLRNEKEVSEILEEVEITEKRFIEIRNNLQEEEKL